MVRGRAGGTGAPFNLGEMTVTRCTVRTRRAGSATPMSPAATRARPSSRPRVDAALQDAGARRRAGARR